MAKRRSNKKAKWSERISLHSKIMVATTGGSIYMMTMVLIIGYLSRDLVEDPDVLNQLLQRLVPVFIGSLIGAILVSKLLVRLLVRKPLLQVISATGKVAVGDLTGRVEVASRDEIGTLVNSFNTMVSHLGYLILSVREGSTSLTCGNNRIMEDLNALEKGLEGVAAKAVALANFGEKQVKMVASFVGTTGQLLETTRETRNALIGVTEKTEAIYEAAEEGYSAAQSKTSESYRLSSELYRTIGTLINWQQFAGEIKNTVEGLQNVAEKINLVSLGLAADGHKTKVFTDAQAEELCRLVEQVLHGTRQALEKTGEWEAGSNRCTAEMSQQVSDLMEELEKAGEIKEIIKQLGRLSAEAGLVTNAAMQTMQANEEIASAVSQEMPEVSAGLRQSTDSIQKLITSFQEDEKFVQEIRSGVTRLERTVENISTLLNQFKVRETPNEGQNGGDQLEQGTPSATTVRLNRIAAG